MPPKRKDFLKSLSKPTAKKQREPQSENDFLEAADEFEQAAGKWKGGDAAKATRFFNRAIDAYNTGLQRYPGSFDLAYNKANLQYQMSQDVRIGSQLGNKVDLLQETLQSHRFALGLDAENADVLFNTAQVLTSLAEALLETGGSSPSMSTKTPAMQLLKEAAVTFAKCLELQEREYSDLQQQLFAAKENQTDDASEVAPPSEADAGDSMETSTTSSELPGDWATVVEPVTAETLLETCIAQVNAMTTLLGLYGPAESTALEADSTAGFTTIDIKVPYYISLVETTSDEPETTPTPGPTLSLSETGDGDLKTSIQDDAVLSGANFRAAVLEASYRGHLQGRNAYAVQLENIYEPLIKANPPNSDPSLNGSVLNAMSAYTDSLMDLASAISDNPLYESSQPGFQEAVETQWVALTKASTICQQLASPPNVNALPLARTADVFLARGDIDLFRFRLATSPTAKAAWSKSKMTLIANAGVFYRGARSYAERAGAADVQHNADCKAIIAEILKEAAQGCSQANPRWKGRRQDVEKVLELMIDEGLVDRANFEGILMASQ